MTFHPDQNLPGCMMPDGGECCEGHRAVCEDWHKQRAEIERLTKQLEDADYLAKRDIEIKKCLYDENQELTKQLVKEQWLPMATAPKDGTSFLATMAGSDDGPYWVLFWNGAAFECVASGATALVNVTHWMPVRSPPDLTDEKV